MNDSGQIRFGVVAILLTLATLAPQRSAKAGFIASNLGSGNTYNTSISYNLAGPQASTGIGYNLAVEFHISGTSPIAFGSAELALEYHGGTNALNVLLLSSLSGQPGATLETISVTNVPVGPSLVIATSSINTMLTPGTNYWLAAVMSGNSYLSWMDNSLGQFNDTAYQVNTTGTPGPWTVATGDTDIAFAINSASLASVPGPSSIMVLGVGAVSVFGFRVRQRWSRDR
jgi:hypothetical protein